MERLTIDQFMEMMKNQGDEIANVAKELLELKKNAGAGAADDVKMKAAIEQVLKDNMPKPVRYSAPLLDEKGLQITENGFKRTKYGKRFDGFADFLRSTLDNDGRAVRGYQFEKTGMSEGTAAQGGYTVPVEYAATIIDLLTDYAIVRSIATINPMGSSTRRIPKQLTQPTLYWVDEESEKTISKPTLTAITQTAKKVALIITFTDELLHDTISNIDEWAARVVAKQMGLEDDAQAFSGTGAPFTGVRNAAGVNNSPMSGASLVYGDLIDLIGSVPTVIAFSPTGQKLSSAKFVTNTTGMTIIQKLTDANGRPIFDFNSGMLLGYPMYVTNQVAAVAGAQPLLFGDYVEGIWISDVGIGKNGQPGIEVLMSREASKPSTNESAFTQDETWGRFVKRESIDIVLADAMSYMDIK